MRRSPRSLSASRPSPPHPAARSDQWIAVRPGTDAALALGLLHVIFRDGLQDQDYLDRYCLGGDQLRERVLHGYDPATVGRITGVAAGDIESLAHEYATTR